MLARATRGHEAQGPVLEMPVGDALVSHLRGVRIHPGDGGTIAARTCRATSSPRHLEVASLREALQAFLVGIDGRVDAVNAEIERSPGDEDQRCAVRTEAEVPGSHELPRSSDRWDGDQLSGGWAALLPGGERLAFRGDAAGAIDIYPVDDFVGPEATYTASTKPYNLGFNYAISSGGPGYFASASIDSDERRRS